MSKLIIKNRFATTPNELLYNPEISLRAKGLYGYIQAKPDGWNFSADRIATESKEGLHSVRMALNELERHGYLQRIKGQDDKGFWTIDYILHATPINPAFENPTSENPTCENPMSENPTSENPTCENPMSENPTSENCTNNINKEHIKKEEEKNIKKEEFDFVEFLGYKLPMNHVNVCSEIMRDSLWVETFMMNNHLKKVNQVKERLFNFCVHLNLESKTYETKDIKEFKRHFNNWHRIPKQPKEHPKITGDAWLM